MGAFEAVSGGRALIRAVIDRALTDGPSRPALPSPKDRGGLDLTLLDYCLSLSPAERLQQMAEYADFVLTARAANGVSWSDTERS